MLEFIAGDPELKRFLAVARETGSDDPGHDVSHVLRVALGALRLAGERLPTRRVLAAALLHDVVNVPKDSPDRSRASELCAEEAARLLGEGPWEEADVAEIAGAIRDHSFSRGAVPETLLGEVLQDADRLDALGAIGILRCVSTGVRMGAGYFEPEDPWARDRDLDDRRWSVDHFFAKLLKLPATMRTEAGRAEAERRVEIMRAFLEALGEEIGEAAPTAASSPASPSR
ncbi:MAG: HD domain-containing protein [Planctomycetota bacterium]|jgi:uncharacterized protein